MDEPAFSDDFAVEASATPDVALGESQVVIWGLGLMGGSLALALRGKCRELVGVDIDPAAVKLALERKIVDKAWLVEEVQGHSKELMTGADLIVLAAPVRAILWTLARLGDYFPGPAVVLDLGSTKRQIVTAMARLPERFDPLGGHPMCGKEKFSLEYAEGAIYQNAPFALTALQRTSTRARSLAVHLVDGIGARALWLDPEDHDRWVAATSHTPYLLANALARITPVEASALVGPGFRSTARLAGSSPGMMVDILATNSDHILAALRKVHEQLVMFEDLLARGEFTGLSGQFTSGMEQYHRLVDDPGNSPKVT